jgi:hypothetical protein
MGSMLDYPDVELTVPDHDFTNSTELIGQHSAAVVYSVP